jgi:hypothetical protein
MMMIKGTILKHYKGGMYEVIGTATHSETLEEMVIYQNNRDKKVWVRPLQMFNEEVERDGDWVLRFEVIK